MLFIADCYLSSENNCLRVVLNIHDSAEKCTTKIKLFISKKAPPLKRGAFLVNVYRHDVILHYFSMDLVQRH